MTCYECSKKIIRICTLECTQRANKNPQPTEGTRYLLAYLPDTRQLLEHC